MLGRLDEHAADVLEGPAHIPGGGHQRGVAPRLSEPWRTVSASARFARTLLSHARHQTSSSMT